MSEEEKTVEEKRKEVIETMTDNEVSKVYEIRSLTQGSIDNDLVKELALKYCDQNQVNYENRLSAIENMMHTIALAKNDLDKNKIDILKGTTEQKFSNGTSKSLRDLEIDNMKYNEIIDKSRCDIGRLLYSLYQATKSTRFDGSIISNNENWVKHVNDVKDRLAKIGVSL